MILPAERRCINDRFGYCICCICHSKYNCLLYLQVAGQVLVITASLNKNRELPLPVFAFGVPYRLVTLLLCCAFIIPLLKIKVNPFILHPIICYKVRALALCVLWQPVPMLLFIHALRNKCLYFVQRVGCLRFFLNISLTLRYNKANSPRAAALPAMPGTPLRCRGKFFVQLCKLARSGKLPVTPRRQYFFQHIFNTVRRFIQYYC